MPLAFLPVAIVSLLAMIGSGKDSSRGVRMVMAVVVPFACTAMWWLLNAFSESDYAMSWSWFIDGLVIFVPTVFLCLGVVLLKPAQPDKGCDL